jgi:uncharacterized protein
VFVRWLVSVKKHLAGITPSQLEIGEYKMERGVYMPAKWLNKEDSQEILREGFYGRLATAVDDKPYIVPVNYAYVEDRIFIHCNKKGRKLDNIRSNPNVCFEVSEPHKLVKNRKPCDFGVRFSSILAFGSAEIVEDEDQKAMAVRAIVQKYAGEMATDEITPEQLKSIEVISISVAELTGKINVDPEDL